MEKSKEPTFPMYSADFLIGVAGMKDADVGQYIKLLCLQHQKGHLTKDQYLAMSPRMSPAVLEKFKVDDEGKYYNPVLDKVLNRRAEFKEKQCQNAAKRFAKSLPTTMPECSQNLAKRFAKSLPTTIPECFQDLANGVAKTLPLENEYIKYIKDYRYIIPPSKTLVSLYCKIRNNKIDADYFVEYYNARGWVYGKQKTAIVDWQAVIRTWESTARKNPQPGVVNLSELNDEKNRYRR